MRPLLKLFRYRGRRLPFAKSPGRFPGFPSPGRFQDIIDDLKFVPTARVRSFIVANALKDGRYWHPASRPGIPSTSLASDISGRPYHLSIDSKKRVDPFTRPLHKMPPARRRELLKRANALLQPQRFDNPLRNIICLKRAIRRRVLFAMGRARYSRHPRRNFFSSIHC